MYKTKILVLGAMMACISAAFQTLPVFLSEAFIILTAFSAIPVYIISRMNPKIGISTAITSFIIIGFFSLHESMLFIFTNGTIGVSLGCFTYYTSKRTIIIPASAVILSATLSIANFAIGIPIFGAPIPATQLIQILIIIAFALCYCIMYSFLCEFIFKKLKRFTDLYK